MAEAVGRRVRGLKITERLVSIGDPGTRLLCATATR
jgi:hypothetical protein